jgi:hypothetical protein
MHSSGILHRVKWQFLADVLGQTIFRIFKDKAVQKEDVKRE